MVLFYLKILNDVTIYLPYITIKFVKFNLHYEIDESKEIMNYGIRCLCFCFRKMLLRITTKKKKKKQFLLFFP
jgi:hypothetical protein